MLHDTLNLFRMTHEKFDEKKVQKVICFRVNATLSNLEMCDKSSGLGGILVR